MAPYLQVWERTVLTAENSLRGGDSSSYIGLLGFVNKVWKRLGAYKELIGEAEAVRRGRIERQCS